MKFRIYQVFIAACLLSVAPLGSTPPAWWSTGTPPVIDPAAVADNHAPANIGQAKWMAKSALAALRAVDSATANLVEADLVGVGKIIPNWDPPADAAAQSAQRAPLLIGQLKAISAPFYQHLNAKDATWLAGQLTLNGTNQPGTYFPWTAATSDDQNKAIANIGQLKAVFSLRFDTLPVIVIPDIWWIQYFGALGVSGPNDDPDGDGLTNAQEYVMGTSPVDIDSDHDGIPDNLDPHPTVPDDTTTPVTAIVLLTPLR